MRLYLPSFTCCTKAKTTCVTKFDQNEDGKLNSEDFLVVLHRLKQRGQDIHARTEPVLQILNENLQSILNVLVLIKQNNLVHPNIVGVLDTFISAFLEFNKLYQTYAGLVLKIRTFELPNKIDGLGDTLESAKVAIDHVEDIMTLLPEYNLTNKLPLQIDDLEKLKMIIEKVDPYSGVVDGIIDMFRPSEARPHSSLRLLRHNTEVYVDATEQVEAVSEQPKRADTPRPTTPIPISTTTKKRKKATVVNS